MRPGTRVYSLTTGPAEIWFRRPSGAVVVLCGDKSYVDMDESELTVTMLRGLAASLKAGDLVRDVYGVLGRVVFVDETGSNPPLITLQPWTGLQRAYVRLWTELVELVAVPG